MGADADARTEHVRAVDLVARAVAAVAAADAIRANEPSSVHGAGDSTLSRPDVRASPCASAPSPAVSCTPSASVPAVTYALPKKMGSALGWTDADRVPLCEAYLEVTSDPVRATARTKENLWGTIHQLWAEKVLKKGPMRVDRLPSALEKQFKRIRTGVSTFTSHYLAVKAMPTTGNLSEEDIISGAVARYCSLDVYDAIRADRDQDKRNDKTRKRKAKVAHCKWVACWRVLRQSDTFSGAANGGDASTIDIFGDSSSDDDASGSGSSRSRRNGGFQGRPLGIKAAKTQRQDDIQMDAQVKDSTEALRKLTDAQNERTALCFFDSPLMRHTPEAARYRLAITQKMLERAGLASSSTIDLGGSEGTDDSIGGVGNGVAGLGVGGTTETPRTAAGPAAGARAPPAPGALAAPLGADGTSASALAAASAAKSAVARVRQQQKTAAGRRSMETKRQAAVAQAARTPATTRHLDEENESTDDDDDSE